MQGRVHSSGDSHAGDVRLEDLHPVIVLGIWVYFIGIKGVQDVDVVHLEVMAIVGKVVAGKKIS